LRLLFAYYIENPQELSGPFSGAGLDLSLPGDMPMATATGDVPMATAPGDVPTAAADYVAGMTDRFAIDQFKKYFVPSPLRAE
jgi:dGTP triphosphohydrolase